MKNNQILKEATQYIDYGWYVIPVYGITGAGCTCGKECKSPGKHPAIADWVHTCSRDTEQIYKWVKGKAESNIGIICGEKSGLFVLDIDGDSGMRTINDLEQEYEKLPETIEVVTGGGWRHLYFKYDDRVQEIKSTVRILEGVDIRSNGSFVVAPPSKHSSGGSYRFKEGCAPGETEVADLPEWLLNILTQSKASINKTDAKSDTSKGIILEGKRNSSLTSMAGKLRRAGLEPEEILAALLIANRERCNPPLEDSELECICKSISKYPIGAIDNVSKKIYENDGVFEKENAYMKISNSRETVVISNFIIEPISMLEADSDTMLEVKLIHANGKQISKMFRTTDFTSASKFKAAIHQNSIFYSFTGNDKDLEDIKSLMNNKGYVNKVVSKNIGMVKHQGQWCFVSDNATFNSKGEFVDDLVLLSDYKVISTEIGEVEPLDADGFCHIASSLFQFNELPKTATILGFTAACFLKERLRVYGIKLNHLIMVGEAGSGKSQTLENVIMPIFNTHSYTAASKSTAFAALKTNSSSNLVPHIIEEFKRGKLSAAVYNTICNLMRDSYDGHTAQRGTADLTVKHFDLRAPIILVGENEPEEAAIRERSLEILFSKADLRAERTTHFQLLKENVTLLNQFGRSLLNVALGLTGEEVRTLYKAQQSKVNKISGFPSRVKNTLANTFLGIQLILMVCRDLGLTEISLFGFSEEELENAIVTAGRAYLMDGQEHNLSIVDNTFVVLDRMTLRLGEDYQPLNNDTEIAFAVNQFYDRFTKYAREFQVEGEFLSITQFCKQLRKTEYFVDCRTVKFKTASGAVLTRKAYVLNTAKLSEKVFMESIMSREDGNLILTIKRQKSQVA
jgi:hypothetical protein